MARRCGVSDVWALTPREWYRALITWKQREEVRANIVTRLAYMVAYWTRVKEPPPLSKFLVGQDAEPQRQTVAQMKTSLQLISEYYGIPLRKGKRH